MSGTLVLRTHNLAAPGWSESQSTACSICAARVSKGQPFAPNCLGKAKQQSRLRAASHGIREPACNNCAVCRCANTTMQHHNDSMESSNHDTVRSWHDNDTSSNTMAHKYYASATVTTVCKIVALCRPTNIAVAACCAAFGHYSRRHASNGIRTSGWQFWMKLAHAWPSMPAESACPTLIRVATR